MLQTIKGEKIVLSEYQIINYETKNRYQTAVFIQMLENKENNKEKNEKNENSLLSLSLLEYKNFLKKKLRHISSQQKKRNIWKMRGKFFYSMYIFTQFVHIFKEIKFDELSDYLEFRNINRIFYFIKSNQMYIFLKET